MLCLKTAGSSGLERRQKRGAWWRVDPNTGERSGGTVLVRYEERAGLIGIVQFLR